MDFAVSLLLGNIVKTFVLGAFFLLLVVHQNSFCGETYGVFKRIFQQINPSFHTSLFLDIVKIQLISICDTNRMSELDLPSS